MIWLNSLNVENGEGAGEVVQRLRALADSREPRFNYHGGSKLSVTPAPDLTPSSGPDWPPRATGIWCTNVHVNKRPNT